MLLPKRAILIVPRQVSMCAGREGVREGKKDKITYSQESLSPPGAPPGKLASAEDD